MMVFVNIYIVYTYPVLKVCLRLMHWFVLIKLWRHW